MNNLTQGRSLIHCHDENECDTFPIEPMSEQGFDPIGQVSDEMNQQSGTRNHKQKLLKLLQSCDFSDTIGFLTDTNYNGAQICDSIDLNPTPIDDSAKDPTCIQIVDSISFKDSLLHKPEYMAGLTEVLRPLLQERSITLTTKSEDAHSSTGVAISRPPSSDVLSTMQNNCETEVINMNQRDSLIEGLFKNMISQQDGALNGLEIDRVSPVSDSSFFGSSLKNQSHETDFDMDQGLSTIISEQQEQQDAIFFDGFFEMDNEPPRSEDSSLAAVSSTGHHSSRNNCETKVINMNQNDSLIEGLFKNMISQQDGASTSLNGLEIDHESPVSDSSFFGSSLKNQSHETDFDMDQGLSTIISEQQEQQDAIFFDDFFKMDNKPPRSEDSSLAAFSSTGHHSSRWYEHYDSLCRFHLEHGHCIVPPKKSKDSLWRWTKRQRYLCKLRYEGGHASAISDERIALLERVGFVWDSQGTLWTERLHELAHYCHIYGHCNVPSVFKPNPSLSTWVKCQRRQYKLYREGKRSNMTTKRIEALSKLGFVFDPRAESKAVKKRRRCLRRQGGAAKVKINHKI